jgi:glycerophosphoryl diester phosphodiesterase
MRKLVIIMTVITVLTAIAAKTTAIKVKKKKFDKEGHRGCRGLMPENTIPAYLKAIELGVTTLEMDAVITKDSQVVMSHEPFFSHVITTKPDGGSVSREEEKSLNIFRMPYEEVIKYDVGLKPHPRFTQQQKVEAVKPLLSEVIDSVETYARAKSKRPLLYNIETKCAPDGDNIFHPEPSTFVELIMDVVNSKGIGKRVIIQSFDIRTLQYVHVKYPSIKTSLLVDEGDTTTLKGQLKKLGFTPSIYSPDASLVTAELIKQCHRAKMKIIPWTINQAAKIVALKEMGVDGIITDYPNLFNEINNSE